MFQVILYGFVRYDISRAGLQDVAIYSDGLVTYFGRVDSAFNDTFGNCFLF